MDDLEFNKDSDTNYWMSLSDMMSGLLMMFILFLVFSLLQLSKQKVELEKTSDEIDAIMGVRKTIVEQLRREFKDSDLDLKIDEKTGSITFSEGVFFDYDKYAIKEVGEKHLNEFIPKYMNIILGDSNVDHISEIIVEGHTDDNGSYMYNLELSQKRSFEVVKYIMVSDKINKSVDMDNLKKVLTANGKSYANPILDEDGNILSDRSRRVEFKFRLKDEEMIQKMEETLNE